MNRGRKRLQLQEESDPLLIGLGANAWQIYFFLNFQFILRTFAISQIPEERSLVMRNAALVKNHGRFVRATVDVNSLFLIPATKMQLGSCPLHSYSLHDRRLPLSYCYNCLFIVESP